MTRLPQDLLAVVAGLHEEHEIAPPAAMLSDAAGHYDREVARRLATEGGRHHFGAFDGEALVAIAHVDRDRSAKQRHRAHIRGRTNGSDTCSL